MIWATWLEGHDSVQFFDGPRPKRDHFDWYSHGHELGWWSIEFFKKIAGTLPSPKRPMKIKIQIKELLKAKR